MALPPYGNLYPYYFPYQAYTQPLQTPLASDYWQASYLPLFTNLPSAEAFGQTWFPADLILLKQALDASWDPIMTSIYQFQGRYSPLECEQKMKELAHQNVERVSVLSSTLIAPLHQNAQSASTPSPSSASIPLPFPSPSVRTFEKCCFVWDNSTLRTADNYSSKGRDAIDQFNTREWTQEEQTKLETFFSYYRKGPYIKELFNFYQGTRSQEFLRDKAYPYTMASYHSNTRKRFKPYKKGDLNDSPEEELVAKAPKKFRLDTSTFFNSQEDTLLLDLVERQPPETVDWQAIAVKISRFKASTLKERYISLKSQVVPLQGDWTPAEKKTLKQGVAKCRDATFETCVAKCRVQWKLISALFFKGLRSFEDCRTQWRDEVNPALIKTGWTDEEQKKLAAFLKIRRHDHFLINGVYIHFEGTRSWKLLKDKMEETGVKKQQIVLRAHADYNKVDDAALLAAVKKLPPSDLNWQELAKQSFNGRMYTHHVIKKRCLDLFLMKVYDLPWTEAEELRLTEAVNTRGEDWEEISTLSFEGTRSTDACAKRWKEMHDSLYS